MLISQLLAVALAVPTTMAASYAATERNMTVVKTTVLKNGQIIDWVHREDQGIIADPPSFPPGESTLLATQSLNTFKGSAAGPDGTVPILRSSGKVSAMKGNPNAKKQPASRITKRGYEGKHWYVSTADAGDNLGTSATLSMYKAFVESDDDFSLLQTAVSRNNVPKVGVQTVEVGWINYPTQVRNPHLFTFFTTNGYQAFGDYLCGWNTEYQGWVQYDNSYYPGMEMTPLAVVDSVQAEFAITVRLVGGNWWVGINGKWIGYYPGNLFTRDGNPSSATLETKSTQVNWYGEILQSQSQLTTTDMGSGHFANEGNKKSAYIRQIRVVDLSGQAFDYDGSQQVIVDDPKRYSISANFNSGSNWGSYFFVGGPGAGGVIGG